MIVVAALAVGAFVIVAVGTAIYCLWMGPQE